MNAHDIDDLLTAAAPRRLTDDPAIAQRVDEMAAASGPVASRRPARRPLLIALPVAGVAALALTGGAIAVTSTITSDVTLPVSYTTTAGESVTCTVEIAGGSAISIDDIRAGAYIRGHDWSGLGQKVHDRAVADGSTWFDALTEQLFLEIPSSVLGQGMAYTAWKTDDCSGEL